MNKIQYKVTEVKANPESYTIEAVDLDDCLALISMQDKYDTKTVLIELPWKTVGFYCNFKKVKRHFEIGSYEEITNEETIMMLKNIVKEA